MRVKNNVDLCILVYFVSLLIKLFHFSLEFFAPFFTTNSKVEKILKGSLDSISSLSPSVKIQTMVGKVCLRCKVKALLGDVNKYFVFNFCLITSSKLSR